MRDFDSNRIYEILGEEFKNIYIVDCKTQQIHAFKETEVLPGFSSQMHYNDAMNQYILIVVYTKRVVTCYILRYRLILFMPV